MADNIRSATPPFFGTGAYVTAILQVRYGVNAWPAFAAGIVAGALVGAVIGCAGLSRRAARLLLRAGDAGLRRGAAHRRQRRADHRRRRRHAAQARPARLPRSSSRAARCSIGSSWRWSSVSLLIVTCAIERSRFGAWLDRGARERRRGACARRRRGHGQARRHDHIGGDHRRGRLLLRAVFPVRRFRASPMARWISIEALLTPIIGGAGTVFGPLVGALVVKALGEARDARRRRRAGPRSRRLSVCVLVAGHRLCAARHCRPADDAGCEDQRGLRGGKREARAWLSRCLSVEGVSRRFGGLLAVDAASLRRARGPHHRR